MLRILHVDSNHAYCELTESILRRFDVEVDVECTATATEALRRLEDTDFECILCDFQMPGMDGLTFLERIRSQGYETPFILLTGQGNEEIAAEALRVGADDYFTKKNDISNYERLFKSIMRLVQAKIEAGTKGSTSCAISRILTSLLIQGGLKGVDIANFFNVSRPTVSRWKKGSSIPPIRIQTCIADLRYIIDRLSDFYEPEEIRLWLYTKQPLLDNRRAIDLILEDRSEEVLTLIERIDAGAYL